MIYVEGYDPQGAKGYYRLFDRSWARFLKVWPLKSRLSELAVDSQDFAHWEVEAAGPNWQVVTRYDFLRQEHIIRANMAEPLRRQIPRALAWAFDYVVSGAIFRVLRASPYFGLVLLYFQTMLIWWLRPCGRRRMAGRRWRRCTGSASAAGSWRAFPSGSSAPSRSSLRCGRSPTACS